MGNTEPWEQSCVEHRAMGTELWGTQSHGNRAVGNTEPWEQGCGEHRAVGNIESWGTTTTHFLKTFVSVNGGVALGGGWRRGIWNKPLFFFCVCVCVCLCVVVVVVVVVAFLVM